MCCLLTFDYEPPPTPNQGYVLRSLICLSELAHVHNQKVLQLPGKMISNTSDILYPVALLQMAVLSAKPTEEPPLFTKPSC